MVAWRGCEARQSSRAALVSRTFLSQRTFARKLAGPEVPPPTVSPNGAVAPPAHQGLIKLDGVAVNARL